MNRLKFLLAVLNRLHLWSSFFLFVPAVLFLEKVRRVWSSTRKVWLCALQLLWRDFGPYRSCQSLSPRGDICICVCSRSAYLDFNASCDTWVKLVTWKWDRRLDRCCQAILRSFKGWRMMCHKITDFSSCDGVILAGAQSLAFIGDFFRSPRCRGSQLRYSKFHIVLQSWIASIILNNRVWFFLTFRNQVLVEGQRHPKAVLCLCFSSRSAV